MTFYGSKISLGEMIFLIIVVAERDEIEFDVNRIHDKMWKFYDAYVYDLLYPKHLFIIQFDHIFI